MMITKTKKNNYEIFLQKYIYFHPIAKTKVSEFIQSSILGGIKPIQTVFIKEVANLAKL